MERALSERPLRGLLGLLPRLPVGAGLAVDFEAADPSLLVGIADDAETTARVLNLGVGAIGNLLAQSAVAIEDGSIDADSVESIGNLLAELGDLGAVCMQLAARCRQETWDYNPATPSPQAA